MGRVIKFGQAAADQIRDLQLTMHNAEARGRAVKCDADRFLGTHLLRASELSEQLRLNGEAVDRARAQQAMASRRCDELVVAIRDDLFNLIGRRIRDRKFGMLFPGGTPEYTDTPPGWKPIALLRLATLIEDVRHRMIERDAAAQFAEELRAAAAELTVINDSFVPLRLEQRNLLWRYVTNARLGNMELHQLKRFWLADGMTEAEIHLLIPSHPRGGATTPPEAGGSAAAAAPSPEAAGAAGDPVDPGVDAPAAEEAPAGDAPAGSDGLPV